MQNIDIIFKTHELTKSFGGVKAVDGVSFNIKEKEIVGLIGPNGAGKTTLFNLITGFIKPDKGSVFFRNQDITNLKPYKICQIGIGRTFQVVRPLSTLTILENLVTAAFLHHSNYREAKEYAIEISKVMGLANKVNKIAGTIPIADKKRLGFAQALATGAKLLLLDEVAAGLNPIEVEEFLGIIKEITLKGITIIMVEHVMKAVMSVANRILVLDHGELIAQGSPKEITSNEKVIKAYLGDQYKFKK